MKNNKAKKKAAEKGEPKVVTKCDNLNEVVTRRLNELVKRDAERFLDDFTFQLTKEEFDFLKSQFAISSICNIAKKTIIYEQ